MANNSWPTNPKSVASLQLDPKNPRLGRETSARAPREIIQYLFEHDKVLEVAQSIVQRGFFANEPLLAVKEDESFVVVEGNRRLAALKALREPGLLEGAVRRRIELLARQIGDPADIQSVPVTLAPSRRATDRLIAGRHVGTPVLAWQAENRASFILDKLSEGYSNDQLRDQLGFTASDIQAARQTRAIADMARSLELPTEIKAKLDNPRAKLFTTLERVFDSTVGRDLLMVKPDPDHGLRGTTAKAEFKRILTRLVSDIALGKQSSRSLNTNDQIRDYFKSWEPKERPKRKHGTFVPADIISGKSVSSTDKAVAATPVSLRPRALSKSVVPRDFKVIFGTDRIADIRRELVKLKREQFPNAGAVLLRVFFELSVLDYLKRAGKLSPLITELESREGRRLPYGTPTLKQLGPTILKIVKEKLSGAEANRAEKAIKYDAAAPFSISELHAFVHQHDLPSPRDIEQFWSRTQPLFTILLQEDVGSPPA